LDGEKKPRAKVPSSEMSLLSKVSGLLGRRRLSDAQDGSRLAAQKASVMILWMGRKPIGDVLLCQRIRSRQWDAEAKRSEVIGDSDAM
jgi:hypothetical protein